MNPSGLAKRDPDKAKRSYLKTVGLALLATPDFSVPVLNEAYHPGNREDSTQFSNMMGQLKLQYRETIGKDAQITIVFDRGNNSESNLDLLESEGLGFHYVGGLKKIRRQNYMRFQKAVINRWPALRVPLRNMDPLLRTG